MYYFRVTVKRNDVNETFMAHIATFTSRDKQNAETRARIVRNGLNKMFAEHKMTMFATFEEINADGMPMRDVSDAIV